MRLRTLSTASLCLLSSALAAAPFAYLPSVGDGRIHVVDLASNQVVANPLLGSGLFSVAASRSTGVVYIGSQGSTRVQVMDPANQVVVGTLDVGASQFGLAVSPDGTRLYASLLNSPFLRIYDIPSQSIVANVPVGASPFGVAVSPDGSRVVVANANSFSVSVVDTASASVVWTLSTPGGNPQSAAFGPSNRYAYVTTAGRNELVVLDLQTQTAGSVPVGALPIAVAVAPDGSRIYTANANGNSVSVVDGQTNALLQTIPLGAGSAPYGISTSVDGSRVYVVRRTANSLAVIDSSSLSVIAQVPIGPSTFALGEFTIGNTVPASPRLDALTPGVGTLTLSFTPPVNDGGLPITGYLADCGGVSAQGPGSPLLVPALVNGGSYACSVRAVNALGPSRPSNALSAVAGLPPDPPLLTAATPEDGQITLQFDAPSFTGDLPILEYLAQCGTQTASAGAAPIVFNGLNNGSSYACSVRARNAVGSSAASNVLNATPRGVPAAPTIVLAESADRQIALTANQPANNGAPITLYTARCSGGVSGSVAAPDRSVLLTGLTNGVTYTCTMVAANVAGESLPSASVSLVPAGPPSPPVLTKLTPGDGTLTLEFQPPTNSNGAPVTGYLAHCGGIIRPATGSPYVYTGLSNGTAYQCGVQASNVGGNSALSNRLTATPRTLPDAPVIGAATPGDASASLQFTPPASDGGASILEYLARCTPTGSGSGPAAPVTVTALSNNVVHRCRVSAVNAAGEGPASAEVSVIPGGGSSADVQIVKSNGGAFVSGGTRVVYLITVSNPGPAAVAGARVQDTLEPGFSDALWTCQASGGAVCAPSGTGNLDQLVDLPIAGQARFTLSAELAPLPEDPVFNLASVSVPAPLSDPVLANNVASDGPDVRGVFRNGFE